VNDLKGENGAHTRAWFARNSFHHSEFGDLAELIALKKSRGVTVTLVLPAREVADTIGEVITEVSTLVHHGDSLVDQTLVVDADSADGTADIAAELGAEVFSENRLMPDYGKALGKGDAMWRSLAEARGDIVMFADADSRNFSAHFISGTLGPLLRDERIAMVKAAYRRPFAEGTTKREDGGGRVTELMAKPLFNLFFPELAGFVQPLAGEFAATRELFMSLPFITGYGVEAGLMIDTLNHCGLDAMAQVDLDMRQNRHQDLSNLGRMSYSVLRAVLDRASATRATASSTLAGLDEYVHAVATGQGLRLDEYVEELTERPPLRKVLPV
jgi:glucosyl-3-phosphoglycerate synthase